MSEAARDREVARVGEVYDGHVRYEKGWAVARFEGERKMRTGSESNQHLDASKIHFLKASCDGVAKSSPLPRVDEKLDC